MKVDILNHDVVEQTLCLPYGGAAMLAQFEQKRIGNITERELFLECVKIALLAVRRGRGFLIFKRWDVADDFYREVIHYVRPPTPNSSFRQLPSAEDIRPLVELSRSL